MAPFTSPPDGAARGSAGSHSAGDAARAAAAAPSRTPPPAQAGGGSAARSDAGLSATQALRSETRNDLAETRPLCAAAPGSEVSPSHLPQHVDIQRLLTNDPLQARVLFLQRLQAHDVLRPHRPVLRSPTLIGLHRHLQVPADRIDVRSFRQQPIRLPKLPRSAPANASCPSTESPPRPFGRS